MSPFSNSHRGLLFLVMSCKSILLSVLLGTLVFTSYCNDPIDPKIQQLREASFQKTLELAELSNKIIDQYKHMEEAIREAGTYLATILSDMKERERDNFKKSFLASIVEFGGRLEKTYNDNVDFKGFLVKEFIDDKAQLGINITNIWMFKYLLAMSLLKSFIEDSEKCLQEVAEIDRELAVLRGQ